MFDDVAHAYDKTNDLLSFGQAKLWRKKVLEKVAPQSGEKILDIAAGTGTSSMALKLPGVEVVAADFSKGMLAEGKKRYPELEFVFADAMKLPFKNNEFDVVTMSFGLRNVQDRDKALGEFLRVLKPGGRLVICEFSHVPGLVGRLLPRLPNPYFAACEPAGQQNPSRLQLSVRVHCRVAKAG